MTATRAPSGYTAQNPLSIQGQSYVGGQFIPSTILDQATPEEKAAAGVGGGPQQAAGAPQQPAAGQAAAAQQQQQPAAPGQPGAEAQPAAVPQQPASETEHPADPAADYAKNGVKAKAFKAWFGNWEEAVKTGNRLWGKVSSVVDYVTGAPKQTFPVKPSKVADAAGKPITVYHGTQAQFDTFDPTKNNPQAAFGPGFYFTENEDVASSYKAGNALRQGEAAPEGNKNARVIAAYLNIKKPFDADTALKNIVKNPGMAKFSYEFISDAIGGNVKATEKLKQLSFDGITHVGKDNTGKAAHRVWIAFHPNQIKSVNNKGTFDPGNDNINLSAADPMTFAEQIEAVSEHQQAADRLAALVILRAEAAGMMVSSEIRRVSLEMMSKLVRQYLSPGVLLHEFLREFRAILRRYEPVLARVLSDGQLASFLQGGSNVVSQLPVEVAPAVARNRLTRYFEELRADDIPEPPEWTRPDPYPGEAAPIIRYPIIEEAAADLARRQLLSPTDYYRAHLMSRMEGFTMSRIASLATLEKVRDLLGEAIIKGDSLHTFKDKLAEAIDASQLSPSKQEGVFRTTLMTSYARGQKAIAEHPAVRTSVAFAWRSEIDDGRLTALCHALSHGGINGTAIYAKDDPVWKKVGPISHKGCRCNTIFLSVERAAAKGIAPAQKWLATDQRPSDAELFVKMPNLEHIPARERLDFESWVSPWADSGDNVRLSGYDPNESRDAGGKWAETPGASTEGETYFHSDRVTGDRKEGKSLGLWLTDDRSVAAYYGGGDGSVKALTIKVKNPIVVRAADPEFPDMFTTEQANDALKKAGVKFNFQGDDDQEFWRFVDDGGAKLVTAIKKAGYDALKFPDSLGNKGFESTLVFDPSAAA